MSTAVRVDPARLRRITRLYPGAGRSFDRLCVMQAVDHVTSGGLSDHPACACPIITGYAIGVSDRMPDRQRQRLIAYIARIAGSRADGEVERRRAYLAATWAVKVFAPLALDARGFGQQAATLRALPDITDWPSAVDASVAASAAAHGGAHGVDFCVSASAAASASACVDAGGGAGAAAHAADSAAAAAADAGGGASGARVWDAALALLDALLSVAPQAGIGGGR